MSPAPQNRQPLGVPVGDQFAATNHAEPGISLGTFASTEEYEAGVTSALSAAMVYETTDVEEMTGSDFDRLLARIAAHEEKNGIEPAHALLVAL